MSTVTVNGQEHGFTDGQTVMELLAELGMAARPVIVERNGQPLERDLIDKVTVEEGDRLEVVQLVGGG